MLTTIRSVMDEASTDGENSGIHAKVPCWIIEFLGLPSKAAVTYCCKAWATMIADPQFWTTLDLRGSKTPSATLAEALRRRPVASSLRHLNLEFCKEITDDDLAPLGGGLESLNLNACHKVTDAGVLKCVARNGPTLRCLELYWHHARGPACLAELPKRAPSLVNLNLSGCQRLEDSGLRSVARHCQSLTALDLTRCPALTDGGLAFLCTRLKGSLRSLNLYASSQFSDEGYGFISELGDLRFLDLCGHTRISSQVVGNVARGCPRLVSLNLTWCICVDDDAVETVAIHCPRLELLSLFGLTKISDASLEALAVPGRCRGTLTTIDVHGCCNVSRQAEGELLKLFPRLTCFSHHS